LRNNQIDKKKDGLQMMYLQLTLLTMILPLYQPHLRRQLPPAQYLLLEILVHLLQTLRCVKIETLAAGLPLPILFDSRRKKYNGSYHYPPLTSKRFGYRWLRSG